MKYHDITPEMTIGDLVKSKVYGDFGTHIYRYDTGSLECTVSKLRF